MGGRIFYGFAIGGGVVQLVMERRWRKRREELEGGLVVPLVAEKGRVHGIDGHFDDRSPFLSSLDVV